MKRLLQFVGLFTIIAAAVKGIIYLKTNSDVFNEALKFIGLLTIILLIAYVVVRSIWGDRWLIKGGKSFLIGTSLIEAFKQFMEELPTPSKPTTAALAGHLVYRFTRIGILGLGIALLPAILLWQQNQLFQHQNIKVDQQTDLLNVQTALLNRQDTFTDMQIKLSDGDRLSSLNFLLGGLLNQIQKDTKERKDSTFNLSNATIGRIAGLSQSFRPYYFLSGDTLIAKPFSPERSQLLVALINSNLNDTTHLKVFARTTFAQANLRDANLRDANLRYADLRYADLRDADLRYADLGDADLRDADLGDADLRGADLGDADLRYADLTDTDLRDADLRVVDLRVVDLSGADLTGANLTGADLTRANLYGADFRYTYLTRADLRDAFLTRADLTGAFLTDADLSGANLNGVINLTLEQLKSVKSLNKVKGISPEIKAQLPECLFKKDGCKED